MCSQQYPKVFYRVEYTGRDLSVSKVTLTVGKIVDLIETDMPTRLPRYVFPCIREELWPVKMHPVKSAVPEYEGNRMIQVQYTDGETPIYEDFGVFITYNNRLVDALSSMKSHINKNIKSIKNQLSDLLSVNDSIESLIETECSPEMPE